MELRHTDRTQVKRPVSPPISLEEGRLDVRRAALAGGFVLGALLISTLGAVIVGWSTASPRPNLIGALFGLAVVVVSLGLAVVVCYVSVREWLDYRRRVEEWHMVAISAYEEAGAVETVEQVNEWALSTENPAHVLLAALWVHIRLQWGEDTPYSARNLRGPILLANRRAAELSKLGAERMSAEFARLGLTAGRSEGNAGEWVPKTADELLHIITKTYGKRQFP